MIELRSVHKSYRVKESDVVALKEIDLTVESGEIFGIIGHSGAGKSTLLRMINFLERPSRGTVQVDGVDLQGLDDTALRRFRQGVGMIFQHFNLVGSKTAGENVAFPLKIAGRADAGQIGARVDELLDLVGLRRHKDKYPRQLSGGEKQRVGIARALANHPRVLLCDEATSALDPQTTRSILQLLRQINEKLGLTIVLITHEMDVIRTVCDRVAVIDSGTIVESGPVSTVFLHPQHETTRRFVQETEHIRDEDVDAALAQSGARTLCRLTFMEDTVHQPILSQTARAFGVDFSILGGRIERIKSMTCGQMTVALEGPAEQVKNALTRLAATGVTVEELRGMNNLIAAWFSNVDWTDIGWASIDTLSMLGWSLSLTLLLGLPLGVVLFLTSPTQLHDAPRVYGGVSLAVNVLRSLPFVILLIAMIPLTQLLTGTSLGVAGSVPALVVAGIPFFGRLVESALREVDRGIIEASLAMGANTRQIVFGALLPEALPGILAAATVTAIALVSYSALAGVVGGGGLGDLAIRYGYQRFQLDVMFITIVLLLLLVQLLQTVGNRLVLHFSR